MYLVGTRAMGANGLRKQVKKMLGARFTDRHGMNSVELAVALQELVRAGVLVEEVERLRLLAKFLKGMTRPSGRLSEVLHLLRVSSLVARKAL